MDHKRVWAEKIALIPLGFKGNVYNYMSRMFKEIYGVIPNDVVKYERQVSGQCMGFTNRGKQCRNTARHAGFCVVHYLEYKRLRCGHG